MNYITCNFQGRLGNLMYEIAATISAAIDNGMEPAFPREIHTYYQGLPAFTEYIEPIISRYKRYNENEIEFTDYHEPANLSFKPLEFKQNTRINGYFTTSLYFKNNLKTINELFYRGYEYLDNLDTKDKWTIHVRRTDYVTDYNWALPLKYYREAVKLIYSHNDFHDSQFVVFTDDKDWCKENLKIGYVEYIDKADYIELLMMSRFSNHIIANSTFSAMAAILGPQPKKVIAPKNWCPTLFNPNVHEPSWIQL